MVRREGIFRQNLFALSPLTSHLSPLTRSLKSGTGLAELFCEESKMTRAQWLLLGAVGLGLAIVIYFMFLCPTDCQ